MILKVRKGGSILCPKGKLFVGGEVIPSGVLSSKQIQQHMKNGFLDVIKGSVATLSVEEIEAELGGDGLPPGVEAATSMGENGKPVKIASKWNLDPDGLRGMSLDQLNVMIMERDDSIGLLDTEEEAIALLSEDYEAPE